MAQRQKRATDTPVEERRSRARRLIAGLRISPEEEDLLAVVRPYFTDLSSEGELAYRLWRRGLELALAEVVSVGARLPSDINEPFIAGLVAQRLLLSLPLLRRTGILVQLGIGTSSQPAGGERNVVAFDDTVIDTAAAEAVRDLGGGDFL